MPNPRKIYIATEMDIETRKKVFQILGEEFSTTENAEEAEFIVLDCVHPAAFKKWITRKLEFVVPESSYPPIILAALGKESVESFLGELENVYDGDVKILPVCETPEEILRTLKGLQAALPFYNTRNTPPPDLAKVREMALAIIRAQRNPE